MLRAGCCQNFLQRAHVIPVAVRGQNLRDFHPGFLCHGEDGGGVIGGIDKQAFTVGSEQIAIVVHLRDGDVMQSNFVRHITHLTGMFDEE